MSLSVPHRPPDMRCSLPSLRSAQCCITMYIIAMEKDKNCAAAFTCLRELYSLPQHGSQSPCQRLSSLTLRQHCTITAKNPQIIMSNDIVQYNIIRWSRADCRMPPWGDQNTTQEDSNNIQRERQREEKTISSNFYERCKAYLYCTNGNENSNSKCITNDSIFFTETHNVMHCVVNLHCN